MAVLVEQADVEQQLQVLARVVPDVGRRAPRIQQTITLLPRPDRVGLDPGKMLEILDGEFLHECAHVRFNTRSLRMFPKDRPGRKFGRPPEQMPMPKIDLFDDDACRRLYPFHLVEGVEGIEFKTILIAVKTCLF